MLNYQRVHGFTVEIREVSRGLLRFFGIWMMSMMIPSWNRDLMGYLMEVWTWIFGDIMGMYHQQNEMGK